MSRICDDEIIPNIIAEAKQATLTTIGARTHAEKWGDYAKTQGDRVDTYIATIAKGDTGEQGIQGVPGYTPVKGVDYFDGEDGYTPVKGVDYFDGQDGKDGYTPIKGVDYFDGGQGEQGEKGDPGTGSVSTVNGIQPVNGNVDIDLQSYDDHLTDYTEHIYFGIDTGTANAKAIMVTLQFASYPVGLGVSFTNKVANTGAVTINVNGKGAKAIVDSKGRALTSGKLILNGVYTLRYNGTSFTLQGEGGDVGTALATDVIAGKTTVTDAGIVTGTIVEQPAYQNASSAVGAVGTLYVRHPLGAYRTASNGDKAEIVVSDANFTPANIRDDKPMFGMLGTMKSYARSVLGEGYTPPKSYRADGGGSLVVEPWSGYYEEGVNSAGYGSIIIGDSNFISSNIVAGKTVLGVPGTAPPGKRMAKGTGTTGTSGNFVLSVRGLNFTPSTVIVTPIQNGSGHYQGLTVYTALSNLSSTHMAGVRLSTSGSAFMLTVWTMLADGFDISTNVNGTAVSWVAYE